MGDDDELWPDSLEKLEIIPLYDLNNDIVAQYLKFSNAGYAVINNDKNNPTAIEFGYDDNILIREILNKSSQPHIIYNSPTSLYDLYANNALVISNDSIGYYEQYNELTIRNDDLASMLSESKQILENIVVPYSDNDFGFIHISDLPMADCNTKTILRADSIKDWGTTKSLPGKDHCGAVATFNLAYYYSKTGFSNLYENHTSTYDAIYAIVGRGPTPILTPYIKQYIEDCGYAYNTKSSSTYTSMRSALDKNHIILLCLADGVDEAHWILGIGYNSYYNDGSVYFRIVDGWNKTSAYYYQPNHGSLFLNGHEIWPTK